MCESDGEMLHKVSKAHFWFQKKVDIDNWFVLKFISKNTFQKASNMFIYDEVWQNSFL